MGAEMQGKVLFYESQYYMLSNFSAFAVLFYGDLYPTAEHAYQSIKFSQPEIRNRIRNAKSPVEAKDIARSNSMYRVMGWNDDFKLRAMEHVLRRKLHMHDVVRDALMRSGDMEIVENSPTDSFWGWGPDRQGQNHLGKIWMKLRKELRSQK